MPALSRKHLTFAMLVEIIQDLLKKYHNHLEVKELRKICFREYGLNSPEAKQKFYQAYWYLKEHRQIKEKSRQGDITVSLVDEIELEEIKKSFQNAKKMPAGERLLVIFDIPQTHTVARNYLRSFLKRNGFDLIQRSALITEKNVLKELNKMIQEVGLEDWVKIFIVKSWWFNSSNILSYGIKCLRSFVIGVGREINGIKKDGGEFA